MISIWQHMYQGMGAAAWLCGFLFLLGLALVLIGGVGYAVLALLRSDTDGEEAGSDAGDEDADPYDIPGAVAPVGKHLRKGA